MSSSNERIIYNIPREYLCTNVFLTTQLVNTFHWLVIMKYLTALAALRCNKKYFSPALSTHSKLFCSLYSALRCQEHKQLCSINTYTPLAESKQGSTVWQHVEL